MKAVTLFGVLAAMVLLQRDGLIAMLNGSARRLARGRALAGQIRG